MLLWKGDLQSLGGRSAGEVEGEPRPCSLLRTLLFSFTSLRYLNISGCRGLVSQPFVTSWHSILSDPHPHLMLLRLLSFRLLIPLARILWFDAADMAFAFRYS